MNDLKCPACGSDKITLEKDTITLTESYGGEKSFEVDNYVCSECDFEGDIFNNNDPIIINEVNKLKLQACSNIIDYFIEKKICLLSIERVLGLPFGGLSEYKTHKVIPDHSVVILLKFLRRFPWLLNVAEAKFDEKETHEILLKAAKEETVSSEGNSKEFLPVHVTSNDLLFLMLKGLMYFCLRVENGTIKSKTTYMKYVEIIEIVTSLSWSELRKDITLKDVE